MFKVGDYVKIAINYDIDGNRIISWKRCPAVINDITYDFNEVPIFWIRLPMGVLGEIDAIFPFRKEEIEISRPVKPDYLK